jgi:hypothetical protein
MYYVYVYCDPRKNNQPFYVGKGSSKRIRFHLTETLQNTTNPLKVRTIQKIRATGFEPLISVVFESEDEQRSFWVERFLIALFGRKAYEVGGILTNLTLGGEGSVGIKRSADTRKKNSEWHRGRSRPEAVRMAQSKRQHGVPLSDTHKRRISVALKGRRPSELCLQKARLKCLNTERYAQILKALETYQKSRDIAVVIGVPQDQVRKNLNWLTQHGHASKTGRGAWRLIVHNTGP